MRTIWHALAWKEWHEHKWKLAAVSAVLLSVTTFEVCVDEPSAFLSSLGLLCYGIVPIALFLGASDAAGEATRGTLQFTRSLPASMRRVAFAKFCYGVSSCVVPIVLSIALAVAWYLVHGRFSTEVNRGLQAAVKSLWRPPGIDHDITVWILGTATIGTTVAVSIYVWTVAIGVNRRTEVRAGGISLVTCTLLWTCFIIAGAVHLSWASERSTQLAAIVATSVLPGGFPISLAFALWGPMEDSSLAILAAMVATLFYPLLVASFICRFGSPDSMEIRSRHFATCSHQSCQRLPLPCRTPFGAILWKQSRESGPIVLLGVLVVFSLFSLNILLGRYTNSDRAQLADLLMSITLPVGFLLALIVGISNFDQDLVPRINEFWRSRPIQVDLWFWLKYLTGMAILAAALFVPIAIASFFAYDATARRQLLINGSASIMMLGSHLAIYAAATAAIIVIRQPIYGAILGIGALAIGISAAGMLTGANEAQLERIIISTEFVTAILATTVAWLAIRYDWGAKSRY